MYKVHEILKEDFLIDILIEANVTGEIKSYFCEGGIIINVPVSTKNIILSKSANDVLERRAPFEQKGAHSCIAGKKDISEARFIYMHYCPRIALQKDSVILARSQSMPMITKCNGFGKSLHVDEIYVLNKERDITCSEEKF